MISCARFNNLVYARTLKAGSEFFYKNFTLSLGWVPMNFSEIDWNYHTVFSYIMDPIQRRHKGISELIIQTGTQELMVKDKGNFSNIIKQAPFLDFHSAPLHTIYRDKTKKINWLLMTNDHQVAIAETEKFLVHHGHTTPIEWNANYTHNAGAYMSEVFVKVKSAWDNDPAHNESMKYYFQEDIELYNTVKQQYHARNHSSQHS